MSGVVPEFRKGKDGLPAVKRYCGYCSAEFLALKAQLTRGRGRFCGRRCAALANVPSRHSARGSNHPLYRHGRFIGRQVPPEIKMAHKAVEKAVRLGELVKPGICRRCNLNPPIHAHHEDYAKPLDVVWLCRQCHVDRHAEMTSIVPM